MNEVENQGCAYRRPADQRPRVLLALGAAAWGMAVLLLCLAYALWIGYRYG